MKVTEVKIIKEEISKRIVGIANILLDNEIAVHGIKIIKGKNGLFVGMPNRRTPNGDFQDIAHPINNETREKIQNAILTKYKEN